MENVKTRYVGLLGFVFLMLIAGSAFVNAAADSSKIYAGNVYIGGVVATNNTFVAVYVTDTGELINSYNTTNENEYQVTVTITDDAFSTTDHKAQYMDNLTFKVNGVTAYTPTGEKANVTTGGQVQTYQPVDINTTPSCTDGVKNRDELMTDCGGTYCTACYDLTVSPTSEVETFYVVNTSEVFTLYVNNTGYHNITSITLTAATCNFTVNLSNTTLALLTGTGNGSKTTGAGGYAITVNKTMGDLTYGTYYCNITVASDNDTEIVYLTLTYSSGETTTTLVRRRYFEMSYTPEQPTTGSCVTLKITDRSTDDAVKEADVDVYLDGVKLFYGLTSTDGVFDKFCPTKAGTYEVKVDKTRYREYEDTITVGTGTATTTVVPVVTTVKPGVTTEEPAVTTEEPAVTTEEPAVTTEEPAVTTEAPVVTTTLPPETGKPMDTTIWLIIIIVIIIILVVLYLVTKKKKEETGGKKKSKED